MNSNLETFIPLTFQRRGVLQMDGTDVVAHNTPFLAALARAFYWRGLLDAGAVKSGVEIAQREGLTHPVVNASLRLTLLAPDIIDQLMRGTQPRRINLRWFLRHNFPANWQAQRVLIEKFK